MKETAIADGEYPNRVPKDVTVSVYMITYNHAEFIAQAIESVLMQKTDFPIELCIGEDRSTDETREICIRYAQQFPDKIRLFLRSEKDKIEGSKYPPGRWNGDMTRLSCRGKYIAILEGDDFWLDRRKLQIQVQFIENKKTTRICATRALVLDGAHAKCSFLNPRLINRKVSLCDLIYCSTPINTCTILYKRNSFVDPNIWAANLPIGDWALMCAALNDSSVCEVMPEVTAVYRKHPNGVWSGTARSRCNEVELKIKSLNAYKVVASPLGKKYLQNAVKYFMMHHKICLHSKWMCAPIAIASLCKNPIGISLVYAFKIRIKLVTAVNIIMRQLR